MPFTTTVLQIIPRLDAGGAERTTVEIAEAIVAAGGRALVATSGGRLADEIERAGGRVFILPVHAKNPAAIWANRGRLINLIRKEAVDLVHVRSRAPAWSALMAARFVGKPIVATYHGHYAATHPVKRLYNSGMVRADIVIANSDFTAASIRSQYRLDAKRLRVIPRGADLKRFDPAAVAPARIEALARAWNLPGGEGALRLLLPARLTFWKGQDIALAAIGRIAEKGAATGQRRRLQLALAGDEAAGGDFVDRVRRGIEELGVRDMVQLVGHCADMPAAYAWADAVLSPATLAEAFGRVAVEAGAMGKPVIASDLGGQRETVSDGETGILCPPGDVVALAEAIEELDRMGLAGRAAMGARATARVRRHYSADAMRAATLDVYAELTAPGTR